MSTESSHTRLSVAIAPPARRLLLPYVAVALITFALFLALGSVIHADRTLAFDLRVHAAIHGADRWYTPLFVLGPAIASASVLVIPLTALWLARQGQRGVAALVFVSQIAGIAATLVIKALYQRVRPGDDLTFSAYLFPSTHTVMTVLAYGLLAPLIVQRGRRRALVFGAMIALCAFVCFALIYLDDHYCTDVIGGLLLGGAWCSMTLGVLRVMNIREESARWRQTAVIPVHEIPRR